MLTLWIVLMFLPFALGYFLFGLTGMFWFVIEDIINYVKKR